MNEQRPGGFQGYDEVRATAALEVPAGSGLLAVSGADAVSFLQGVLTNDIASLSPGQGCYAAYLTAQGRMLSDMHVLRRDRDLLLVVEPHVADDVGSRLDQSIFTEQVVVDDLSSRTASVVVHGPASHAALVRALPLGADAQRVEAALRAGGHATLGSGGAGEIVVFAGHWLGVPAARVLGASGEIDDIRRRLMEGGVVELGAAAFDARRIEAGTPVFGIDMTTDTIPLEAGLEHRAISTTKGCYVGQEIIVRILHRAHGRVGRHLVGLVGTGHAIPARGATIFGEGREVGRVTTGGWSPALGAPVALAFVHREAFDPGTVVAVGAIAGEPATVRELPLVRALEERG